MVFINELLNWSGVAPYLGKKILSAHREDDPNQIPLWLHSSLLSLYPYGTDDCSPTNLSYAIFHHSYQFAEYLIKLDFKPTDCGFGESLYLYDDLLESPAGQCVFLALHRINDLSELTYSEARDTKKIPFIQARYNYHKNDARKLPLCDEMSQAFLLFKRHIAEPICTLQEQLANNPDDIKATIHLAQQYHLIVELTYASLKDLEYYRKLAKHHYNNALYLLNNNSTNPARSLKETINNHINNINKITFDTLQERYKQLIRDNTVLDEVPKKPLTSFDKDPIEFWQNQLSTIRNELTRDTKYNLDALFPPSLTQTSCALSNGERLTSDLSESDSSDDEKNPLLRHRNNQVT